MNGMVSREWGMAMVGDKYRKGVWGSKMESFNATRLPTGGYLANDGWI